MARGMSTTGNSRVGMSGMTATQRLAHARSANAGRVKPGERFISPTNAGAQMTPARMAGIRPPPGARVSAPPRRPVTARPKVGGQYTRGAGTTTPPGPVQEAVNTTKKLSKRGRGLMIGAGAAVIAGLAYSGRRGEGSSGGRTSMSRY